MDTPDQIPDHVRAAFAARPFMGLTPLARALGWDLLTSGPEDFHLRALPEPYVNLSIHTAPIVRPLPWQSNQWARSLGFARRNRSNQSLAPLVWWRSRLNLRRAHLMT